MKNKNKHDHRLTNFLKVIIFMLVMLAPFFAIGVKCYYVMNNENAKDSYLGSATYQSTIKYNTYITSKQIPFISYSDGQYTNYTLSSTSFNNIETNIPRMTSGNVTTGLYGFNVNSIIFRGTEYTNIKSVVYGFVTYNRFSLSTFEVPLDNNTFIGIDGNTPKIYINASSVDPIYTFSNYYTVAPFIVNANLNSNIIYTNSNNIDTGVLINSNLDLYLNDTTLSSVFYSATEELDKTDLFSWTKQTAIYSGLNAMTDGLGIKTNIVAVLLTYWTIITSIYIIIDIILEMFIFLTHWLNDKIC